MKKNLKIYLYLIISLFILLIIMMWGCSTPDSSDNGNGNETQETEILEKGTNNLLLSTKQQGGLIEAYSDINFNGNCYIITKGNEFKKNWNEGKTISSIKCYNGASIILCSQENFYGRYTKVHITHDIANLGSINFNDKAKSYAYIRSESERQIIQGVTIQSMENGKYVCADLNISVSNTPLTANRNSVGELNGVSWEKYDIIILCEMNDNWKTQIVSFKAHANGLYVCADYHLAEVDGNQQYPPLLANRGTIGIWEMFQIFSDSGHIPKTAIYSIYDKFVGINENNSNAPLFAPDKTTSGHVFSIKDR